MYSPEGDVPRELNDGRMVQVPGRTGVDSAAAPDLHPRAAARDACHFLLHHRYVLGPPTASPAGTAQADLRVLLPALLCVCRTANASDALTLTSQFVAVQLIAQIDVVFARVLQIRDPAPDFFQSRLSGARCV